MIQKSAVVVCVGLAFVFFLAGNSLIGPRLATDLEAANTFGGVTCNSLAPDVFDECVNGGGSLTCNDTTYPENNYHCFWYAAHFIDDVGLDCSNVADAGRPGYNCPVHDWNEWHQNCDDTYLCLPW